MRRPAKQNIRAPLVCFEVERTIENGAYTLEQTGAFESGDASATVQTATKSAGFPPGVRDGNDEALLALK